VALSNSNNKRTSQPNANGLFSTELDLHKSVRKEQGTYV